MTDIIDLNSHRPGWVYDEITGCWYNPADYPGAQPEIWVVSAEPGPGGVGTGYACFSTEAEANRWRLANGLSATTKLVRFD